jgi:hypothetical protein
MRSATQPRLAPPRPNFTTGLSPRKFCNRRPLGPVLPGFFPYSLPTTHYPLPTFFPLCFHILTNCFSRNSLVFTTIRIAPGVYPNLISTKESKMTQQTLKPSLINNSARCTHRFANGRRCRLSAANLDSVFCPSHASLPENLREPAAASLTADLKEFRSALPINDFLARLLLLLAENKISPRRAAVLAYITNQLLRTLPAIDRELNPKEDSTPRSSSSATCPALNASIGRSHSPLTPMSAHNQWDSLLGCPPETLHRFTNMPPPPCILRMSNL